jgi:formylglycine-generating enzyme required for sulfatase activity
MSWPIIKIGSILGDKHASQRFEVLDDLGGGAFGQVYRCKHARLGYEVALKTLKPQFEHDREMLEHFEKEGKLWCNLSAEENIVSAKGYHVFPDQNHRPFLEIDYIEGTSLLKLWQIEEGYLSPGQVVRFGLGVARGLRDVYDRRKRGDCLLHRDISPDNILIRVRPNDNISMVTDFGLARFGSEGSIGVAVGKWLFMAPEIVKKRGWTDTVDHRADIYSFGVSIYHCLTGKFPLSLRCDNGVDDREAIVAEPRRDIRDVLPSDSAELPSRLVELVMSCLAIQRENRPQSWEVVYDGLNEVHEESMASASFRQCLKCKFMSRAARSAMNCPLCGHVLLVVTESSVSLARGGRTLPSSRGMPYQPSVRLESSAPNVEFVKIPAGKSVVGCNRTFFVELVNGLRSRGYDPRPVLGWEKPEASVVSLPGFEISRTPVTAVQFENFMRKTGYVPKGKVSVVGTSGPDMPVTGVTMGDAEAFCDWIGGRLPSAEEWEKAARGLDGRPYPWGSEFSGEKCTCKESGATGPRSVLEHAAAAGPFGLIDCVGNVGEMVDGGRPGARLVLGGSYEEQCEFHGLLWGRNMFIDPAQGHPSVGFRVVKDAAPAEELPAMEDRFVTIAGEVTLGCDESLISELECRLPLADELLNAFRKNKLRVLELRPFEVCRFPVTNEDYWEFVRDSGYAHPEHWRPKPFAWTGRPFLTRDKYFPVVGVARADAQAYCRWLQNKTGRVYRLPTGEEWEAAARGKQGRVYPWGDTFSIAACNGAESPWQRLVDVRLYPDGDSPFGCRQMTGNCFEWIAEAIEDEKSGLTLFCKRGGSFACSNAAFGISFFELRTDSDREPDTGFRITRKLA